MNKETPPPYSAQSAPAPGFVPPAGPPPGPQMHQHRVIVTAGTVAGPVMVGPEPMITMCPYCHANITTTMETEANTKTHMFALLLCVFGCWPCCCIPYCMDSCQSRKHYCPNCRAFLGAFSD